jgi:hypothetical protein
MATAASAANRPTTAAARSEISVTCRSQATSSTPTGSPSRSTGCHSAVTRPDASTSWGETPPWVERSAKNGSRDANTWAVAELVCSVGTISGSEWAPAIAVDTRLPAPSGSMRTAIAPSHTSRAASQMAVRAEAASAVRGSRRATSATTVRSAAYWKASTPASSSAWRRSVTSRRASMPQPSSRSGSCRAETSR